MKTRHHRTVTIYDADWQFFRKLGDGNASKGMSNAVQMLMVRAKRRELSKARYDSLAAVGAITTREV